jgi:DNA adenine methylase
MSRELKPTRPVLRYHGGKWELAAWIISHFPPHRIYVEPYGGGGSVLLQKSRSWGETYNDLDGEVVNLLRVLRSRPQELIAAVELTPFARDEYRLAFEPSEDPLEWARRVLIRSHMGHAGGATHGHTTGFRSNTIVAGSHPASQWRAFPQHLPTVIERLRGVVIENRDALEVMRMNDAPATLNYVDPPYPQETRDKGKDYRFEMSADCHRGLAECLQGLQGMVIISGYACELYDRELYAAWHRVEREHYADGRRKRTEVLWINEAAWRAKQNVHPLFKVTEAA